MYRKKYLKYKKKYLKTKYSLKGGWVGGVNIQNLPRKTPTVLMNINSLMEYVSFPVMTEYIEYSLMDICDDLMKKGLCKCDSIDYYILGGKAINNIFAEKNKIGRAHV